MSQRTTRPSNALAHPGMVDRNPPRRSREELQSEREAKAAAKARAEKEKAANIRRVAAVERAEQQKIRDMDREANDPMEPATQATVRKGRKRPVDMDEAPADTPMKRKKRADFDMPLEYTSSQYPEAVKLAVAKLDALLNESGSSESEYKGGKEGSVTEDDSESEGEPEDEEGDGEERTTKKKRGKQPKKGHLARDQIIAAVAAMSEAPSPFGAAKGRVGSKGAKTSQTLGNRSSSPTPFGLVQDWQTPPFTQAPIAGHSGSQTCGTIPDASQRSIVTTRQQDSSGRAASEPSDHADYHYGSIIPEKEELEQQDPEDRARKSSSMYKSITRIQDLHTPRLISSNKAKKKRYLSYDDLPLGTKDAFKKIVIPLSLEAAGAKKPWENPSDDAIISIWNYVYDDEIHIEGGDVECDKFLVAKTLIKRAISSWLHKFADAAERALLAEFTQRGLNTEEARSGFVLRLLGDEKDMSAKKRPFLWQTAYDNPSARQEGIFQGRLVARTFLEHVQIINSINKEHRGEQPPVGALILAIQAVHRALLYSVTGTFLLPSDKKAAEFSKTNWDDYTLSDNSRATPGATAGGRVIKRSSTFLKVISNLKEQQWADIFKVASSFQAIGKQNRALAKDMEPPRSETDTDEDDELVDPRYADRPIVEESDVVQ